MVNSTDLRKITGVIFLMVDVQFLAARFTRPRSPSVPRQAATYSGVPLDPRTEPRRSTPPAPDEDTRAGRGKALRIRERVPGLPEAPPTISTAITKRLCGVGSEGKDGIDENAPCDSASILFGRWK